MIEVTKDINSNIKNAIEKAIETNSKETFLVLDKFILTVLHTSFHSRSLEHFIEYIFFPAFAYNLSFRKIRKIFDLR